LIHFYKRFISMEQPSKRKNASKDCYHYQIYRHCSAGEACAFYHRDLDPNICTKFIFGECQQRPGEKKCPSLHVRESFLPFPPSSEVARLRRMKQEGGSETPPSSEMTRSRRIKQDGGRMAPPATPPSLLSRPGQLRNIKRLLGGRKWLQVKILEVESVQSLYVRPADVVEEAFLAGEQVNTYYCSPAGEKVGLVSHQAGQLCAVLCGQAWHRAVLVTRQVDQEDELVLVQLLDEGGLHIVHPSQLYELGLQFQCGPSWSLPCHLNRVTDCLGGEEMVREIKNILAEVECPQLEVLGSPLLTSQGQLSVPVDIKWEQLALHDDPFLPLEMEDCSLSCILVDRGMAQWIHEELKMEDLDKKESNSENEKEEYTIIPEFDLVTPMKENIYFRWLDPELPATQQFEARGTFVDDSGQIYLQLHEQRATIRLVRRLLQEKFFSSEPDCDPASWRKLQECVVRWRDGLWYRARFIDYVGGDPGVGQAVVLLVDYGDTFMVEVEDLRRTLYCQNIPIQCIKVILHNIIPRREKVWSTICLDFLQDKIHYSKLDCNELLRVKVESKVLTQPLPVSIKLCPPPDLGDFEDIVWVDLASLLEMIEEAILMEPPLKLSKELMMLRGDLSFGVKYVSPGYYKDKEVYSLLGLTYPKLDWEEVGIMVNDLVKVTLVDIESYNTVYVQLSEGGDGYLAKVQDRYKEMSSLVMGAEVRRPGVGQAVGVWWEGEGWCRAVVKERGERGKVFVEFVDFGTKDWVEGGSLRQVPEEWLTLPPLAVKLQLGIEVKEGVNEDLVCEMMWESMCEAMSKGQVMLNVVKLEEEGRLCGHLLRSADMRLVYQEIVKEGHVSVVQ